MKIGIIFCVLAISSAYGLLELRELAAPIIDPLAPNLYYVKSAGRSKRAIVTKPLDDPNNCISICATQLNTRLTELQLNATFAANVTDAVRLQLLCQAFSPAAPCFHACPVSQLGSLIEDFLPVMSLICNLGDQNYPELLKSLACINTTKSAIDERCNSKCDQLNEVGSLDSALGGTFSEAKEGQRNHSTIHVNLLPNFVVYDDNKTQNTENFQAVCSYLSCVDDCDDPIIKDACGPQAVRIQNKLISTIVQAITALFRDLNAVDGTPKECKRYDLSTF